MKVNTYAKLFTLTIVSCVLFCSPVQGVPSAPWPAGVAINAIDQSPKAPSLATFRHRLYMVWKAEDASNRIFISSTSDGTNWLPSVSINDTDATRETPALVASPMRLYIAFKASDGSNTIYVTSTPNPEPVAGMPATVWPPARRINSTDQTATAPALYYFNGNICLAWSSVGTNQIYFLSLRETPLFGIGTGPGHRINSSDQTPKSPSLASWRGKLYLAWKSQDPSNRIFITSSPDGRIWPNGRVINSVDSTRETPVLLNTAHRLYLAFKSNDSFNTIHLTSASDTEVTWPAAVTINSVDSTPLAPALGFYQDKLFMAWKSNDSRDQLFATSSYAQESEFFFNYLGDYPSDSNPGWHEEAQGMAHDHNNWFITQRDTLWKIPLGFNLDGLRRAARHRAMRDYPALAAYNHFGDPDYAEIDGRGYLVVPLENGLRSAIAVFNAEDLAYVGLGRAFQAGMPWCALDSQGRLYSSSFETDSILRYDVNWNELLRGGTELGSLTSIRLSSTLHGVQGGEITPSGELMYMVADGIQVIDLATGQVLIQSSNGLGPFNFEYSPGRPTPYEEPEGLTIWDLDDGREPNIRGQLHVLLLDNDVSADEISFKHYGVGLVAQRLSRGSHWMVAGSVVDPSGAPTDAEIHVFLKGIELGSVTAERGRFSIYDLPRGKYRVVARSRRYPDRETTQDIGSRLGSGFFYTRWELQFR